MAGVEITTQKSFFSLLQQMMGRKKIEFLTLLCLVLYGLVAMMISESVEENKSIIIIIVFFSSSSLHVSMMRKPRHLQSRSLLQR